LRLPVSRELAQARIHALRIFLEAAVAENA